MTVNCFVSNQILHIAIVYLKRWPQIHNNGVPQRSIQICIIQIYDFLPFSGILISHLWVHAKIWILLLIQFKLSCAMGKASTKQMRVLCLFYYYRKFCQLDRISIFHIIQLTPCGGSVFPFAQNLPPFLVSAWQFTPSGDLKKACDSPTQSFIFENQ